MLFAKRFGRIDDNKQEEIHKYWVGPWFDLCTRCERAILWCYKNRRHDPKSAREAVRFALEALRKIDTPPAHWVPGIEIDDADMRIKILSVDNLLLKAENKAQQVLTEAYFKRAKVMRTNNQKGKTRSPMILLCRKLIVEFGAELSFSDAMEKCTLPQYGWTDTGTKFCPPGYKNDGECYTTSSFDKELSKERTAYQIPKR